MTFIICEEVAWGTVSGMAEKEDGEWVGCLGCKEGEVGRRGGGRGGRREEEKEEDEDEGSATLEGCSLSDLKKKASSARPRL